MGWLKSLITILRGRRGVQTSSIEPADPNDIVARNGLVYGPPPDPISDAAKAEIERQKDSRRFGAHR
jgi:hypothetical protein